MRKTQKSRTFKTSTFFLSCASFLVFGCLLISKPYFKNNATYISGVNEVSMSQTEQQQLMYRGGSAELFTFTHIFNPFTIKSERVIGERNYVYKTWKVAAEKALKLGIQVNFVAVVLEGDIQAVVDLPFPLETAIITKYFENFNGIKVPFIGDILNAGVSQSHNEFIVFTNLDIALKPTFYQEVVGLIKEDLSDKHHTLIYLRNKINERCDKFSVISKKSCDLDLMEIVNNEGFRFDNLQQIENFLQTESVPKQVFQSRNEFAMTITRMDIEASPSKLISDSISTIAHKGKYHPGNDCFVLSRKYIPDEVYSIMHPVGLRPWGTLLRTAYKSNGLFWRRVVATPENFYTYHLGLGEGTIGKKKDSWLQNAKSDPLKMLNLQANNIRLYKYLLRPTHCTKQVSLNLFRAKKFCKIGQTDLCRGITRYQCIDSFNYFSRDILFAKNACQKKELQVKFTKDLIEYCDFIKNLG